MSSPDRFFRDPSIPINEFFDEGPVVVRKNTSVSGAIDMSASDKYRQGVEIQSLKQWDAGLVKIYSGEPGHVSLRSSYGFSDVWTNDQEFVDHYNLDPVAYIAAKVPASKNHNTRQLYITLPGHSYDSQMLDKYLYDGVLNALNARDRMGFLNATQQPAQAFRGAIQSGNEHSNGSDLVVNQYRDNRSFTTSTSEFHDASGYNVLYEVDLGVQPSQDWTSPGQYTVDGKTWWVKGALGSNYTEVNSGIAGSDGSHAFPGRGLHVYHVEYNPNGANWYNSPSYNRRVYAFPIDQLAGYNPSLPLFVEWRIDAENFHTQLDDSYVVGLADIVLNSSMLTDDEKSTAISITQYDKNVALFCCAPWDGTTGQTIAVSPASSTNMGDYTWGLWKTPSNQFTAYRAPWSSSLSLKDPELMTNTGITESVVQSTSPCLIFCVNQMMNGVTTGDACLRNLRFIQPAVPFFTTVSTFISASYFSSETTYVDVHSNAYEIPDTATRTVDFVDVLLQLTSSTDSYITPLYRSAPCGFDYDNCVQGSDSIAFGGLKHS